MMAGILLAAASADPPWAAKTPLLSPELFAPGRISTGEYESHAEFEPDGSAVWFLKSTPTFEGWTIVRSRWTGNDWGPTEVASFSGRWRDADPFLTPDGKRLYFISDRPGEGKTGTDMDLWFVERSGAAWGEPKPLGAPVNSEGNEWFPSIATSGTLYFGSDRPGGKGRTDIWCARLVDGKYAAPENLGDAVNSRADDFEACVAPDESFLVIMSNRQGGSGGGDLWLSERKDGAWQPARAIGSGVNSPGTEIGPRLSPDGKYLFFSSSRSLPLFPAEKPLDYGELSKRLNGPGNGLGDVYRIETRAVLGR